MYELRIKRYAGNKYFFEIESTPVVGGTLFCITAIDRVSGKKSQINDLNFILSAFDIDVDDPRVEDKDWVLSSEDLTDFQIRIGRMLRNQRALAKLEFDLDDDRKQSEWANTHPIWEMWLAKNRNGMERNEWLG